MRKIKVALFLPVFHFLLAVILLRWAVLYPAAPVPMDTPYVPITRLVCWGISAPAERLRILSFLVPNRIDQKLLHATGFYSDTLIFLVGVVILWYLIGRAIDFHWFAKNPARTNSALRNTLLNWLMLVCGIYLFIVSVVNFNDPLRHPKDANLVGNVVEALLFFAWSIVLMFLPARRLLDAIRGSGTV